ncbi:MAG: peptidase M23, partial [Paludibacter sp.]
MESHPAGDIYNDIWSSKSIKYNIPASKLPETFIVDCSNFRMPLDMSKGRISSKYGPRWSRFHHGIDIAIPRRNNIYSAFDGEVRVVKYERRGYGHYVVIRHNNGLETVYAHLHRPLCKINQRVKAGDVIGLSGNTGRSTGPHLHF